MRRVLLACLPAILSAAELDPSMPLTCQPRELHPNVPIFHIIGNVSVDRSVKGGLTFEHINDANGVFKYKGVYHIFHQCCQNHWDHVVSTDMVHWKRLPSPVHPDDNPKHWYDEKGSFDGSAAILPGKGPVILVDNIGPFVPPGERTGQLGDYRGCQGISWPVDPSDPELTNWRKDPLNPMNITNMACGSLGKNGPGAFPSSIFQNGDHWNYISYGYRFTTSDPTLHEWRMVEEQMLSQASSHEQGGQWFLRTPNLINGSAPPPNSPSHIVSCGQGNRFCFGNYNAAKESWADYNSIMVSGGSEGVTDYGPNAGWFTAGYESGTMGAGGDDRIITIGWVTGFSFDPRMPGSGGLTVPRQINYDPRIHALLTNPVTELTDLRNASLAEQDGMVISADRVHTIPETGGGDASSADIEVSFVLPTGGTTFGVIVLSNAKYINGADKSSHGVEISTTVSAPAADGTRAAEVTIVGHNPGKCMYNITRFPRGCPAGRNGTAKFTVLADETTLDLRILVDRVVVEAFMQGGRAVLTKTYTPSSISDSFVHLVANETTKASRVRAYSMGCGWVGVDEEHRW